MRRNTCKLFRNYEIHEIRFIISPITLVSDDIFGQFTRIILKLGNYIGFQNYITYITSIIQYILNHIKNNEKKKISLETYKNILDIINALYQLHLKSPSGKHILTKLDLFLFIDFLEINGTHYSFL